MEDIIKMEKKQYYLGLDMGTNSVGWAVTDSSYNLISKKGKDLWGIREFDEAKTSAERRTKRISRRRHQRSQVRIGLLREYFADEIEKNDELFYLRMENSKYFPKDKDMRLQSTNGIFDDDSYKDADYYNDYPTIFHLRKALIEDSVPFNEQYCRKVYLALLNMFKHRGHFLNASLSDRDEIIAIAEIYPRFVDLVDELLDLSFPVDVASELEDILADRSKSRSAKSDALMDCCNFSKTNKKEQLIIKCLCGLKVDGKKLFDDLETEDKIDICFSDFAYEEKAEDVETALGQEYFELVDVMKQIFDAGQLSAVMHGYTYLSFARVDSYKKHEKDLKILKNIYRSKTEDEYNAMFRDPVAGSYSAYVNTTNSDEIEGKKLDVPWVEELVMNYIRRSKLH